MATVTLPSPIVASAPASSALTTQVAASSPVVTAADADSAIVTAMALASPIDLEDTET